MTRSIGWSTIALVAMVLPGCWWTLLAPPDTKHPLPAPFELTPQDQAELDRVLEEREERCAGIKTFTCRFVRREYDPVFGPKDAPRFTDHGTINYAAPEKIMLQVDGKRAEKWVYDGKSIYEYNYPKTRVIEHRLPPQLQPRSIAKLAGLFAFLPLAGWDAETLKERYFIRIIAPPGVEGEVRLEAYPRFKRDSYCFSRIDWILTSKNMLPLAVQTHSSSGKNRISYVFSDIVVDGPLAVVGEDPFYPLTPPGWEKVVDGPPTLPRDAPD